MSYVIQAVLSNAQHPEYGQVTIPFPIPNQNYDCTIELLEPLEIGDTLRQDCQVDELDSFYTVLNALIGTQVTLDDWTIWPSGWTALMTERPPSSRGWPTSWGSRK